jgi:hypothetical protein
MKIIGKITSAKYRNGIKQNSGDKWECVDYYLVEQNAQSHRSEFPFSLFNEKMRTYALHEDAEGEFDVQVTNEVRNGYNNIRVFVNGFKGIDQGKEKVLGSYAEPNSAQQGQAQAQQPNTAANGQTNTAAQGAFDPSNGGFGASGKEEPLPFD